MEGPGSRDRQCGCRWCEESVLGLARIGGSAMTLSTIGILAALGGFAAVYVACVTHPEEGGYWRRDQSRASH
jgi:hypothetical protein